jgi:histidinol-phosphate aminotransferase
MGNVFNLRSLVRKNIWDIKPYSSARDEYSGEAAVFLDANENPYSVAGQEARNRYPDPYQRELKQAVAEIKGLPAENIFLGNGSDEAIDLLYNIFCSPGADAAVISSPTYGMYSVSANTNDCRIIDIPLKNGVQLDSEAILQSCSGAKLVFICSPNNPTGNLLDTSEIEALLAQYKGIVVIDEAYIDYSGALSWSKRLGEFPNLVVLQTFSKAWGLANIRLGMMFASKEIIALANKIKLPYNISGIVQEYALRAIESKKNTISSIVAETIASRDELCRELCKMSFVIKVLPSDANFVLVKTTCPKEIYQYLLSNKIVIRDRSSLLYCQGAIRITIGTPEENRQLIEALKQFGRD